MKRADKIKRASELAAQAAQADTRDPADREAARREWGQVRKAARDAFLARQDWAGILNDYKERDGFYTPEERAKMCKEYADTLILTASR